MAKKTTVKKEEVVGTPEVVEEVAEVVVEEVKEEVKKEEEKSDVIGRLKWGKEVHQKLGTVKVKSIRGVISHRELPEDIQKRLKNKWYWTNVYEMPEEWLEKRNVDRDMLAKLKKFISDKYL